MKQFHGSSLNDVVQVIPEKYPLSFVKNLEVTVEILLTFVGWWWEW